MAEERKISHPKQVKTIIVGDENLPTHFVNSVNIRSGLEEFFLTFGTAIPLEITDIRDLEAINSVNAHALFRCAISRSISISKPKATAIVIRSFVIGLTPTEEGYMATSQISNSYELGVTPQQAIRNYLEFLVDELIWLEKNQENLSSSIHEDFSLLQSHLRIV